MELRSPTSIVNAATVRVGFGTSEQYIIDSALMPSLDPRIFRAYDIRGKALTQCSEEACRWIAFAFGHELKRRYSIAHPHIAVGRDMRTHSPLLERAVIEGLAAAGCRILVISQTPSPVNYFTICTRHLDGGIQVTASHNPPEDNGVKLQMRNAEAFAGEDIQNLRRAIEEMQDGTAFAPEGGSGNTGQVFNAVTPYIESLTKLFGASCEGLRVVTDYGNGVTGPVYGEVLRRAGCALTELYAEPDGTFPNHPADPAKHDTFKDLQAKVRGTKADCGIAFDGDGDRFGLTDETGQIRSADEILLLLAKDHLTRHPGAPVVFTVSNSSVLQTEIKRFGGVPVMCKVGHAFVEHEMERTGALLGGEQSGHFFCFEDAFHYDDALVAALRTLAMLRRAGRLASTVFAEFPKVYQAPEYRPHCPDDRKGLVVQRIIAHFSAQYPVNTLDGARVDFGDGAWAGIRQSNTSPCLSVCIEAQSPEKLRAVEEVVLKHLQTYPEVDLS